MKSKLTVIVPVYNTEQHLKFCLDSILNQSYHNFVLILVDDGSTDLSGCICDEYAGKDSRIQVVHTKNQGSAMARNTGLDLVQTEYITMIDSDDCVNVDYLKSMMELVDKEKVDVVAHRFKGFCLDSEVDYSEKKDYRREEIQIYTKKEAMEQLCLAYSTALISPCKLYKTSIFEKLRYPSVQKNDDEWIAHYVIENCEKMAMMEAKLYYYRFSEMGQTRNFSMGDFSGILAYIDRIHFLERNDYEYLVQGMYLEFFEKILDYHQKCKLHEFDDRKQLRSVLGELKHSFWKNIVKRDDLYSGRELFERGLFIYMPWAYELLKGK